MDATTRNIFLFFLALFTISSLLLGWLLYPFVSTIILAAVITGIFRPIYKLFTRMARPVFASLATCLLVFLLLFIPSVFFVGVLTNEAYDLVIRAREVLGKDYIQSLMQQSVMIEKLNHSLAAFNVSITGEQLNEEIPKIVKAVGKVLFDQANQIGANILKLFINFFFMLLIIYYLLIDADRLINFIANLSPLPDDQDRMLMNKFKDMARAILVGNGLCGMIQGIIGGLIFWLFGFKSAIMWGFLMALLAFLPLIGIGIVFLPASAYLIVQGRILEGIVLINLYLVLSGGIEYLFKPRLVGKQVKMHTLLVFLSLIGGLKLFGILGIIYGPLIITAFLTLTDIYHSNYQIVVEPTRIVEKT